MLQHNTLISGELSQALRERATREGVSVGEVTRRILEAGVDKPMAGTPQGRVTILEERVDGHDVIIESLERRLSAIEELAQR